MINVDIIIRNMIVISLILIIIWIVSIFGKNPKKGGIPPNLNIVVMIMVLSILFVENVFI